MDDRLKPFAEAVGEICNEWAHLEQWVDLLFLAVAGWDYRLPVTSDMSKCLDFRDKLRATKVGAIIRTPPGDLLESVVSTLDYIDNELRATRNRYVHDIWSPDSASSAIRHELDARATKESGNGARTIRGTESIRIPLGEAHDLIADIISERERVMEMVTCYQASGPVEVPALLATQPQRLHLRRQQEKQRQTDISRAAQKRPPKSSLP